MDKIIDVIYDFFEGEEFMLRKEFHKEWKEWGPFVAIYNLGFVAGSSDDE